MPERTWRAIWTETLICEVDEGNGFRKANESELDSGLRAGELVGCPVYNTAPPPQAVKGAPQAAKPPDTTLRQELGLDEENRLLVNETQWSELDARERQAITLILASFPVVPAIRVTPGPGVPRMPPTSCELACHLGAVAGALACASLTDAHAAALCTIAASHGKAYCLKKCP